MRHPFSRHALRPTRSAAPLGLGAVCVLVIVALLAPKADAFQAPFKGKLKLDLKEIYEDDSTDRTKETFKGAITDASLGTSISILFEPGVSPLSMAFDLVGKSDRKAKVVDSSDPATDRATLQEFLASYGDTRGTPDVTFVHIKKGWHRVTGNFQKSMFKLMLKGTYVCQDGPLQDQSVDFKLKLLLPKGKRIAF